MADQVVWTSHLVKVELSHIVCCPPDSKPCSLRYADVERVPGRHTNTDWASFQLAAHARADVVYAMGELWPQTVGLDWEHLSPERVRELPRLIQSLWVVIIRGPWDRRDRQPEIAEDKRVSRFGFMSHEACKRILRRRWDTIQADADEAIGTITAWLSPWREVEEKLNAAWRGMRCTDRIHTFGVGGVPHDDQICRCGRTTWLEWRVERAAKLLERC